MSNWLDRISSPKDLKEIPLERLGELAELPAGCRPVWESEHWGDPAAAGSLIPTRRGMVIRQAD